VELVTAEVARMQAALPVAPRPLPVGVVVPGILDERAEVVVSALNLGWEDVHLGALLRERIDAPLAFGHDVRAGALAEATWGAGRWLPRSSEDGPADLLFVPIGTGVAAAVIRDGEIFGDRWTGEIGQVHVADPFTGASLRLEQVASASAIARRFAEHGPGVPDPRADGGRLAAREVVDRAREGDEVAKQVLVSALDTLAQALANVLGGLGPMPVVIGGGLAEGGAIVVDTLREAIGGRLGVMPTPLVLPGSLGMWAGCQGAGLLALRRAWPS
jgi:glucokinase